VRDIALELAKGLVVFTPFVEDDPLDFAAIAEEIHVLLLSVISKLFQFAKFISLGYFVNFES
jgi:hypothetical protein